MFILDISSEVSDMWDSVVNFFIELWENINSFLLRFLPQDIIYMFLFAIGFGLAIFILLTFINKDR